MRTYVPSHKLKLKHKHRAPQWQAHPQVIQQHQVLTRPAPLAIHHCELVHLNLASLTIVRPYRNSKHGERHLWVCDFDFSSGGGDTAGDERGVAGEKSVAKRSSLASPRVCE